MLDKINSVYFLGIGGIGMSALARYFLSKNCKVYGYDKTSTKLTQQLEDEGAIIHFEESVSAIPNEFKFSNESSIIIYTPAIPKDHKELVFFIENNIRLYKRSEVLGLITNNYFTVAVAGTHGKTTTSSMVAHVLQECGVKCMAFLGGIATNFNSNLLLNDDAKVVVVEADEFDRSFLTLSPNIASVSSLDADHLDIYGDKNEMVSTYQDFVNKIENDGVLVTKSAFAAKLESPNIKTFGVKENADYQATSVEVKNAKYHVSINNGKSFQLGLPGNHNVENAMATYAIAKEFGIDDDKIAEALASYKGVKRRFEYQIEEADMVYIDDYAHHPSELNYSISSVRELYPGKKITGVFQPHLFSRTNDFMDEFAESLSLLDELLLMDIYPARELPIEGVTSDVLLSKVNLNNKQIVTKTNLVNKVVKLKPEVLLTLGAGDIDVFVKPLKNELLNIRSGVNS